MHPHHEAERRLKAVVDMGFAGAAARIAELEAAVKAALNMVDGNGAPPNWDWMRAVLAGKSAEYYRQNASRE